MTKEKLQQTWIAIGVAVLIPLMGWLLITVSSIQGNRFTDGDGDELRRSIAENVAAIKALAVLATETNRNAISLGDRIDSFRETVFGNSNNISTLKSRVTNETRDVEGLRRRLDALLPQIGSMSGALTRIETILEDRPPQWLKNQVQENTEGVKELEKKAHSHRGGDRP